MRSGKKINGGSRRCFLLQGGLVAAALTRVVAGSTLTEKNLVGVWRLVEHQTSGEDPFSSWVGVMIFTAKHFSRALMGKDRQQLSFNFERESTLTPKQAEELLHSFRGFRAFSGTYEVNNGVLIFHSEVISNIAHLEGNIQRNVERSGNRLRLWGKTRSGRTAEELWEKIE